MNTTTVWIAVFLAVIVVSVLVVSLIWVGVLRRRSAGSFGLKPLTDSDKNLIRWCQRHWIPAARNDQGTWWTALAPVKRAMGSPGKQCCTRLSVSSTHVLRFIGAVSQCKDCRNHGSRPAFFRFKSYAALNPELLAGKVPKPKVLADHVGHGGGNWEGVPQSNTVLGAAALVRLGITTVEVDVMQLRDGTLVCMHDGWERKFGLPRGCGRLSLKEYRKGGIGSKRYRAPAATLQDFLDAMRPGMSLAGLKTLVLDMKRLANKRFDVAAWLQRIRYGADTARIALRRVMVQVADPDEGALAHKAGFLRVLLAFWYKSPSPKKLAAWFDAGFTPEAVSVFIWHSHVVAPCIEAAGHKVIVHGVGDHDAAARVGLSTFIDDV